MKKHGVNLDARAMVPAFDLYLERHGLKLEATVIGGAALQLLGLIERPTADVDVLCPNISDEVKVASVEFAQKNQLKVDWLNNGPASLMLELPSGWRKETRPLYEGQAIRFSTLSRLDLLRSKIYAYLDRAKDLPDCIALAPSAKELEIIRPWLEERDANPQWPQHVRSGLKKLGQDLDHDV